MLNNEALVKRFKSFMWRQGVVFATAFVAFVAGALPTLGLPETLTVIVAGVLGEVTKALNSKNK